jgi:general secretion pathway protein I
MARMRGTSAFTLMEVMMAITILAMCLTAIFSSEGGAVRMAHRARRMGAATLLARCKMGEIEEQVAEEGLPALFDSGSDECCEEGEIEGYTCDWELVPIVLPETMFAPEDDAQGGPFAAEPEESSDPTATGASVDPSNVLSGGSTDGLAAMALGYVFPILKPAFESQIRRATVIVRWREGSSKHEMDVTQYLVSGTPVEMPTEGGASTEDPGAATGSGKPDPDPGAAP